MWYIFLYWCERMKRRKLKREMQQLRGESSEAGNKALTMCFQCPCSDTGPGNCNNELSTGDGIATKREEMSFSTCIKARHASVKEDVPRAQKCTASWYLITGDTAESEIMKMIMGGEQFPHEKREERSYLV